MISLVLELCTAFVQFFISIGSVPTFNVPASWKLPMNYLSVFNLDLAFVTMIIPELNDFRIYFLAVSVVLPLTFIFFGLVFINPFRVVMWYLGVVAGVLMFAYGCFIAAGSNQFQQSDAIVLSRNIFLIAGAATLVGCGVLFLVRNSFTCCQQPESEARALVEVKEDETKEQDKIAQLQRFIVFLVFGSVGALFCGLARVVDRGATQNALDNGTGLASFGFGVGITLMILGGFAFIYMIVGCCKKGREIQWDIARFFDLSFLRLLLIGLSLTFIPICAGVFVLFNCTDLQCPKGTRMLERGSGLLQNASLPVCPTCTLAAGQICPASLQAQVCNDPQISNRLQSDQKLHCSDLQVFFWPAAFLVVVQFMLGVPLVFQNLIMTSTGVIDDEFSVKLPSDADATDPHVVWSAKVAQCENVARFMFQPFRYSTRYTRLFQLIEKLLIVFTGVFVFQTKMVDSATIGLSCALIIHFVAGLLLIIYKPFIRRFENILSIVMEAFLVVTCIAALMIQRAVDIPEGLLITIFVLNGLLPLIAFIIGVILEWSSSKNQEEQEAEEQRKQIEEELAKLAKQDEESGGEETPKMIEGMVVPPGAVDSASNSFHELPPTPTYAPPANLTYLKKKKRDLSPEELRLRRLEAQQRVLARRKEEAMELLRHQQDTDLAIDRTVKSRLNKFLMAAGILGFLALALCLVGYILVDSQVIKNDSLSIPSEISTDFSPHTQFGGYNTWSQMTQQCCCTIYSVPARSYVAERWVCTNGKAVERVRQNIAEDGFAHRSLCAIQFSANCVEAVSNNEWTVTCNGTKVTKYV